MVTVPITLAGYCIMMDYIMPDFSGAPKIAKVIWDSERKLEVKHRISAKVSFRVLLPSADQRDNTHLLLVLSVNLM